ncbi:phosphate/phosphite/phosphonate ABC transporter substrate-binding protein [Aestuariispira insulae]|uniref:Phosphonate transport system substrate-binding protein n=1 Tax=Aestuariispira insulae TaxID=1461337 RepID=A0A3D9HRI7_9PROT|nr:phosphate/phosphite/phosphonate ABC transporter substrate-binding protein [Aestuariispira insulae]RED52102.1 phosphonate transport system substrate-binding protein [Aestuariispira insulae]
MSLIKRLGTISCLFALAISGNTAKSETLILGVVPQFDARKIQQIWAPIAESLSQESGVLVTLQNAKDIPDFEKKLAAGHYDLAYANPYHALVAHRENGYLPVVRDIGRSLSGIIVVRKDSGIRSIKELNGRKVAFPAPNALGAALIPRAEFDRTFSIEIEPRYVKSHSSVYLNVMSGFVAAGGGVKKTFEAQPESVRNALTIIHTTVAVPPHPVIAHPRLNAEVRQKIQSHLLELGKTPAGQNMLSKIPMKKNGTAGLGDLKTLETLSLENYFVRS